MFENAVLLFDVVWRWIIVTHKMAAPPLCTATFRHVKGNAATDTMHVHLSSPQGYTSNITFELFMSGNGFRIDRVAFFVDMLCQ